MRGSQALNRTCAMVAALGYMFSGKWLLHLLAAGHTSRVGSGLASPGPPASGTVRRRGGLSLATWAGAVLALVILGSHPQFTFYAGILIRLDLAPGAGAGRRPRSWRQTWRRSSVGLGRWFAAVGWCCLVALALTAVQLLPTLEASRADDPRQHGNAVPKP